MAKPKKGSKENPVKITMYTAQDVELQSEPERDFAIIKADIKDDFCNHKYEVISGPASGEKHNVNGPGLIMDTLRDAFGNLRVHLACIDDAFKHAAVAIDDIDQYHMHDLTNLYHVTGFEVKGSKGNECIVLKGNKFVSSVGARMEVETPKVALDDLSPYKWYAALSAAVEEVRNEVALYKEGNYSKVETDVEDEDNPRQLTIADQINNEDEADMEDFESAKI